MLSSLQIFTNFVFLWMSEFIKKSGPKWVAALIDEAKNIHLVNTLVLYASIENVALIADIPNFSKLWKILSMYRWFVYSMFLNSGVRMLQVSLCQEGSLHSVFGFDPSAPVSWNLLLSTQLENFRLPIFESPSIQFPGAWPTLFLSSSFPLLTRDPKLGEEISSLHWLRITRFTGLAFCCW